jgi:hypothetical protein
MTGTVPFSVSAYFQALAAQTGRIMRPGCRSGLAIELFLDLAPVHDAHL